MKSTRVSLTPVAVLLVAAAALPLCHGYPHTSEAVTLSSSKATDLEMELKSLQDVSEKPDFFDELVNSNDQEQQQENKLDDEDETSIEDITTLTPTSVTEEETRVDEPTDRGPTEPTSIVEVTKPTMNEESALSNEQIHELQVTKLSSTLSEEQSHHSTGFVMDDASGELVRHNVDDGRDASEELHMIKSNMMKDEPPTDDLISATLVTTVYPEETTQKKDVKDHHNEESREHSEEDSGESEETPSGNIALAPEQLLPVVGTQLPKLDTTETAIETFTRNARKSPGHVTSLSPLSHASANEDLLQLLMKASEQPGSWPEVAQILGKLDYETSSKLKTALQMKALKEKNHKGMVKQPNYMYHPNIDKSKMIGNSKAFHQNMKPKTENDINKQALIIQSGMPAHKEHEIHRSASKADERDSSKHVTGTYHTHWQRPRPPSPMHMLRINYLKDPSAIPPTLSSIMAKTKGGKISHGSHSSRNVNQHYDTPINAIAIDVPGMGKSKPAANAENEKHNKQAYIAVTVYKPTKNKFHKVDLKPKMSQTKPVRFQHDPVPLQKQSKSFAMEKPVTIISQKNQKYPKPKNNVKNELGSNSRFEKDHKVMKSKLKNKNQAQATRPKPLLHPAKWKPKAQLPTDEMEAQLIALSMMEKKLKDHLMQKERLRQRLRMKHHNNQHRVSRATSSYM